EGPGQHVVSAALAKWAEDDPMAAVEWIRKNAGTHPEFVTEESKQGVLKGAAMQDPRLAFQLAADLGLKNPGDAGRSIGGAAKTPGERTAVLAALRGHLAAAGTDATANEGLLKSTMAGIGE